MYICSQNYIWVSCLLTLSGSSSLKIKQVWLRAAQLLWENKGWSDAQVKRRSAIIGPVKATAISGKKTFWTPFSNWKISYGTLPAGWIKFRARTQHDLRSDIWSQRCKESVSRNARERYKVWNSLWIAMWKI